MDAQLEIIIAPDILYKYAKTELYRYYQTRVIHV